MLKKLTILLLSIFLVLCAGFCNIYPIYLEKLKKRFDFSLTEVNLFGTCVNMGLWVAFPMGFIYDKFGPRISCFISLIILSFCYSFLNMIMNQDYFLGISIYPLLVVAFLMGQGSILLYTASLATNLKNFRYKGNSVLIALLIAIMAVSPSIFTTYKQNLKISYENFFSMMTIFLIFVILLSLMFLEIIEHPYSDDKKIKNFQKFKEEKVLRIILGFNIFVLGVYIFSILFNFFNDKNIIPIIVIYPVLLLLNFLVIIVEKFKIFDYYFYYEYETTPYELKNLASSASLISLNTPKRGQSQSNQSDIMANDSNINLKGKSSYSFDVGIKKDDSEPGKIQALNTSGSGINLKLKDFTPLVALRTKKFIFIFMMLLFGIGSVIANLNNIQFILKSCQGVKKPMNPLHSESHIVMYFDKRLFIYMIMYFIFNSGTRMISGFFLDYLIKRKKFYHYILFFSGVGFISQILGIFMEKHILYVSISLAGATHGGYFTFVPTFVKNEFGLKNWGKILGLLTIGAALGSLIISDYIFIYSYDYFSKLPSGNCRGRVCFYPSYIITSFLFIANICMSYILVKEYQLKVAIKMRKKNSLQQIN